MDPFEVAGVAIMLFANLFVKLHEAKRVSIRLSGPRNVDSGRSKCRLFAEFLGLVRRKLRGGCKFLFDLSLIGSGPFRIDLVGRFGDISQYRNPIIADLDKTRTNGETLCMTLGRYGYDARLKGRDKRSVLRHYAGLAGKRRNRYRIYLCIDHFSFWSYDLKFKHLDF